VERAAEEYSLDEPIDDATHASEVVAPPHDAGTPLRGSRNADIEGICANPLRDEPHPVVVGAVKRFGLAGLVACALGTGLLRWCKSLAARLR
jgi:hypothetical protein